MALLATQSIAPAGLADALAAAAGGGDTFRPDDGTFLRVNNGGGSPVTVTVVTPETSHGLAIADLAVVVPAGASRMIGPFPSHLFADPTTGLASVTYSGVTSVTVGAFKLSSY